MNRKYLIILGIFSALIILFSPSFAETTQNPDKTSEKGKSLAEQYREMKEGIKKAEKGRDVFDTEARIQLAKWALETGKSYFKELAARDLKEIIQHEPEHQAACQMLETLGFVNYEGKWLTLEERHFTIEKKARQLLDKIGSKNEKERAEAKEELSKIEPEDKINPLVKGVSSKNEEIKMYSMQSLGEIKYVPIVPLLVEISLQDKSERVKEQAFSAAATINKEEAVYQYGYWALKRDDASRKTAIDALKKLTDASQPDWNASLTKTATYYLILTMYRVTVIIQTKKIELQGLRNFSISPGSPYSFQLPQADSSGLSTVATVPAGMIAELESHLEHLGNTLESITSQKMGKDYEKWVAWWQENYKEKVK
jgi:hypothetical protein